MIRKRIVLTVSVGAATTVLDLILALYAVRATTPLRYAVRILYILPIITPPFVVGKSLILLFGRAGTVNDILMFFIGPDGVFTPEGSAWAFQRSGYIFGHYRA